MTEALAPCPFCNGLPQKREVNFWTGMRNDLIRVEFIHHCEGLQPRQRATLNISAVTEEEAIAAWNRRATPAPAQPEGRKDMLMLALTKGIPLEEPVRISKALLAQREARVVLNSGVGPVSAVHLVNIGLTGWVHTPPTAEAYAKGFNDALRLYRSALLSVAGAAAPVEGVATLAQLQYAHAAGFRLAANWMERDHLIVDVHSPAYARDRDRDLAAAPKEKP